MTRGFTKGMALLCLGFVGACETQLTYRTGNEAATNVVRHLSGVRRAHAAIDTGEASYLLSPDDLMDERVLFMGLLGSAGASAISEGRLLTEGERGRKNGAENGSKSGDRGLTAVARPQVYEEARADGTLLVERCGLPGEAASNNYEVSFRTQRDVDHMVVRSTPDLDRAWAAIAEGARAGTRSYITRPPSDRFVELPLESMQKAATDEERR
jgi:hypothetical protein